MRRSTQLSGLAVALGALPAVSLGYRLVTGSLGANPVEELTHVTGEWALRLLLASLAVTPIRQTFGLPVLAPLRRTLGLLAFGYVALHLGIYGILDRGLEWKLLLEDVSERPFITAGAVSFLCLLPLAITSTRGWIRRLGRRWTQLHRLVYLAAIAAVIHFLWLVKADLSEPLVYATLLGLLLGARVTRFARKKVGTRTASA